MFPWLLWLCERSGGSKFFLGDRWRTMKGKNLKLVRGLAVEDARRGGSWCLVQTW